jgi:hypothetical protein
MALTEYKRRTMRRLRWQHPWHGRRRSDSSARCSAVEKTFSHAVGRAARQGSPAIRLLVRTSGIRCSARRRGVQLQPDRQAVSTAVSMLTRCSHRDRAIAFRKWCSRLVLFLRACSIQPRKEFGVFPNNRIHGSSASDFDVILRQALPKPGPSCRASSASIRIVFEKSFRTRAATAK